MTALLVLVLPLARTSAAAPVLTVSPQPVASGSTAMASGRGFCPSCGQVDLVLDGRDLRRATVNPGGSFSVPFVAPGEGRHQLVARQPGSGLAADVSFSTRGAENEVVQEVSGRLDGTLTPEPSPADLLARLKTAQARGAAPAQPVPASPGSRAGDRSSEVPASQVVGMLVVGLVAGALALLLALRYPARRRRLRQSRLASR